MQIPPFSPNLLIIAILIVATIYALVAGKQRVRLIILSVYVGIVLAEQFSQMVKPYVGFLSLSQTSLLLLGLPVLIFGLAPQKGHKGEHDKGSSIANMLVGMLTGGFIVASALRLMPTSEMAAVDGDSFVAMVLQQYQLWLLGALPIVALLLGMFKSKESSKKH
jgi:hypothetical protein